MAGTLTVVGATTVAAITASGTATFNGNVVIGNAAGDTLTIDSGAWTLTNGVTVTGTFDDLGVVTTVDINGGTIDGAVIGGASAAAGTFTTLTATTSVTTDTIAEDTADNGVTIDGITLKDDGLWPGTVGADADRMVISGVHMIWDQVVSVADSTWTNTELVSADAPIGGIAIVSTANSGALVGETGLYIIQETTSDTLAFGVAAESAAGLNIRDNAGTLQVYHTKGASVNMSVVILGAYA
jgi:hypothetical protein